VLAEIPVLVEQIGVDIICQAFGGRFANGNGHEVQAFQRSADRFLGLLAVLQLF
jgi:hypothetical protein